MYMRVDVRKKIWREREIKKDERQSEELIFTYLGCIKSKYESIILVVAVFYMKVTCLH